MSHLADQLAREAEAAIAAMQAAAVAARAAHARSELMRHMLTTARKVLERPPAEAIETVVREWMDAWSLDRAAWPHLAREMEAFTAAVRGYVLDPADAADRALRAATAALEAALAAHGTSIADQMAWRSQCAHRWWELVAPTPADLPGRRPRPAVPPLEEGRPFWEAGCAAFCR